MGLAFYNVLGAIGGFISPYIVGRLSNGGSYNSSMYVQGAFNLAAALMVLGESLAPAQPCIRKAHAHLACDRALAATAFQMHMQVFTVCFLPHM